MSVPGQVFYPLLTKDIFSITHSELFIYHLPILVADIFILLILSRWLKNKHTEILLFYWLSPVLIYINYFHSQLDVIPIAFVFGFLYYLFKERWWLAFVFLAAAIACKFHIIILIPFAMVYLWRTRRAITPIIGMLSVIGVVFIL
jgi:Gpi18-like mannosyltransferase